MLIFNGLASWSSSKFGPFFVNVTMPNQSVSYPRFLNRLTLQKAVACQILTDLLDGLSKH
jgi:hypothetical protein